MGYKCCFHNHRATSLMRKNYVRDVALKTAAFQGFLFPARAPWRYIVACDFYVLSYAAHVIFTHKRRCAVVMKTTLIVHLSSLHIRRVLNAFRIKCRFT